jgi:hypothetical protein
MITTAKAATHPTTDPSTDVPARSPLPPYKGMANSAESATHPTTHPSTDVPARSPLPPYKGMTNSTKPEGASTSTPAVQSNDTYICEWTDHDASHLNRIDTQRSPGDIRTVGKAPYGYTADAYAPHDNPKKRSNGHMLKRFVPHAEDRLAVAMAFDMYVAGHQRTDIARALNAAGFVPPSRRRAPRTPRLPGLNPPSRTC